MTSHVCRARESFELLMVSYPRAVRRCVICHRELTSTPMDDLVSGDMKLAEEMIQRFRQAKRR